MTGRIAERMTESPMYRGVSDITEVFALLNRRLTGGEVGDVRQSLHAGLRDLWPE